MLTVCLTASLLTLTHCGPKKEDETSKNSVAPFSVDSGSCPEVTDAISQQKVFEGSCKASVLTIPKSERSNFSVELKFNLKLDGAYFQVHLDSTTKQFLNGALIRFRRTGNATEATVSLNNMTLGTVRADQMHYVNPNDVQIVGTIMPTNSGTRVLFWNLGNSPYTSANVLFDSTNPGHFTNNSAVTPNELMTGLFRGFWMQDTVLSHIKFLDGDDVVAP